MARKMYKVSIFQKYKKALAKNAMFRRKLPDTLQECDEFALKLFRQDSFWLKQCYELEIVLIHQIKKSSKIFRDFPSQFFLW